MHTLRFNSRRIKAALAVFIFFIGFTPNLFTKTEVVAKQFDIAPTGIGVVQMNIVERRAKIETVNYKAQEINADFNIMIKTGYTAEELSRTLTTSAHKAMKPYIDAIVKAERTYGVNALYLLCKLGLESGWGRYMAAKNNIAGWTNNDGSFRDFDSVEDCIMHVAKNISTTYKEVVGTRLADVCERYCPGSNYTETLIQIMTERASKI